MKKVFTLDLVPPLPPALTPMVTLTRILNVAQIDFGEGNSSSPPTG